MDDFHNPQPHDAPEKSTVTAVLDWLSRSGDSVLSLLSGLLAAVLILYSAYVLYDSFYIQNQAFSSGWDMLQYKPEIISDGATPLSGADTLASINEDYRAWLTMYDTKIDYPVMQGKDDLYYASHDIYGEPSLTGAIYLASGNTADLSDSYNLIYGHHMDNGAMFGALDKYLDRAYFDSHREGILITPTGIFDLYVFAVVETDAYEGRIYSVGPDRTVEDILSFLQSDSSTTRAVIYDEEATRGAVKITAMSTCASAETNGRLVVFCVTTQRNLITLTIPSYEGVFDALHHTVQAIPSYGEGTLVEYSTDGGITWTTEQPVIYDVGTVEVLARATNDVYGRATASATLIVHPRPVTVSADPKSKVFGEEDPPYTASESGIIDDYILSYQLDRPGRGTDENVGTYRNAIIPTGEEYQGNYIVSYYPADFTITAADTLALEGVGYEGIYDAQEHPAQATVNITEGTTIEYSTDGGRTWSETPPSIINVGEIEVMIRATNPNYEPVEQTVTLRVEPRPVLVSAVNAEKNFGEDDPEFTAIVEGLLGNDTLVYRVYRSNNNEEAGTYYEVLIAEGEQLQGNYLVSYVPANFTILPVDAPEPTPTPGPTPTPSPEEIEDPTVPLVDFFQPKGGGKAAWALVNLLCVIATGYLLLPLLHLKDKFGRKKLMEKINQAKAELQEEYELQEKESEEKLRINLLAARLKAEKDEDATEESVERAVAEAEALDFIEITGEEFEEAVDQLYYKIKKFLRRFRTAIVSEIVLLIAAIIAFILTEDMRTPMILIDKWTPLMVLILAITWIVDVRLARYRAGVEAEEEEKEEEEQKRKEEELVGSAQ